MAAAEAKLMAIMEDLMTNTMNIEIVKGEVETLVMDTATESDAIALI